MIPLLGFDISDVAVVGMSHLKKVHSPMARHLGCLRLRGACFGERFEVAESVPYESIDANAFNAMRNGQVK